MTIQEFATAVQTQIAAAAGLPGNKVIWESPGHSTATSVPRPARPFLTLAIIEDGNQETLPEESMEDNPDPDPDTYAFADLETISTPAVFEAGAKLESTISGFAPNVGFQNWQVLFDGQPSMVYAPDPDAVSWSGTPEGGQNATLTVHIQPGVTTGEDIAAALAEFLGTHSEVPLSLSAAGLPVALALATYAPFDGGSISQNPLLLKTTDRPEITVRVIAFADAARTGAVSPAFTMLRKLRGKMGSELTADALDPITVLDRGNVTNATLVLETGYEGRAVLDLKFGSIETETEGINTIETVKTRITVKNLDDSTIIDKTITLPNS